MTNSIKKIAGIDRINRELKGSVLDDNSLISYYRFEGNVVDEKGNNNGTAYNLTYGNQYGKFGQGILLNGTNGAFWIGTTNFSTSEITINVWATPTENKSTSLLSSVPDASTNRINIHLPWNDQNIYFDFGDLYSNGRLSVAFDSAWFNVKAMYTFVSASGVGMQIYRNGVLIASSANKSTVSLSGLTINVGYYAANSLYWPGEMDELAFFNCGLSLNQIQYLYNTGIKRISKITSYNPPELYCHNLFNDPNLVWYYRMEGNATDAKGNNNGTDTGVTFNKYHGKFGQGAYFNGTNSKITLNQTLTRPLTISFWIKPFLEGNYRRWITNQTGAFDNNSFCIRQENDNRIYLKVGTGAVYGAWATSNVWSNIAIVVTTTNAYLYINGSIVSAATITDSSSLTSNLTIGGFYAVSGGEYFYGAMDEIAYFSRELSSLEILSLYQTNIKKFMGVSNV